MSWVRQLRRRASRSNLRLPLVWFRHRGLNPADVFIASYPRSGSTWLRFVLFEILTGDAAGFDNVNRVIADVGLHRQSPALVPNGGRLVKTHEAYRDVYQKAIYLVRDPRDAVISEYEYEKALDRISEDFDSFLMLSLKGRANVYGPWQEHVMSWLESPLVRSGRLLVIKFEELRQQTEDVVTGVLNFLGVEVDSQAIRDAIANNSIQRMRAKEDRWRQHGGASPLTASGEQRRFINSGSVGGWRARLTEAQARLVEQCAGSGLARMGYPLGALALPVGSPDGRRGAAFTS
jgi:hypothetical protein